MKRVAFLTSIALFLSSPAFSQWFAVKPYLQVTNTISGKTWKLKTWKNIDYTTIHNSFQVAGKIKRVTKDSLFFFGGGSVNAHDINAIKFRPRNFFNAYGKAILYILVASTGAYFAYTFEVKDAAVNAQDRLGIFSSIIIFSAFFIESGGLASTIITPKRELYSPKNLKIEIVTE